MPRICGAVLGSETLISLIKKGKIRVFRVHLRPNFKISVVKKIFEGFILKRE